MTVIYHRLVEADVLPCFYVKTLLSLLAIIVGGTSVLFITVATTLGYFPGVSRVIGLGAPKDLGITYTDADYLQAREKLDTALDTQQLQTQFTDAELTALLDSCTESACVFDDVQVKIESDGTLKLSGTVDRRKVADLVFAYADNNANLATLNTFFDYLPSKPAFYIQATVVGESDVVIVDLEQLSLGSLWIADLESLESDLNRTMNEYLAALSGQQVASIELTQGNLQLDMNLTELEEEALH